MSNKIEISDPAFAGLTVYALARLAETTTYVKGTGTEAYNSANLSDYAISLTEQTRAGLFSATFPAVSAGWYTVEFYTQAGGSPAVDDDCVGDFRARWTGTAWDEVAQLSNVSSLATAAAVDSLATTVGDVSDTVDAINGKMNTQPVNFQTTARTGRALDITIGDDYHAEDGRALPWSGEETAAWPDLTGASIFLAMKRKKPNNTGTSTLQLEGEVVTPTGDKAVQVEADKEDFQDLFTGLNTYDYRLWAVLASGGEVTLATGSVNVLATAAHEEV